MKNLLSVLLLMPIFCIAQKATSDNTSDILSKGTSIENKLDTLAALYNKAIYSNPKEALVYARKRLKMADSANLKKYIMDSYHLLGSNHNYLGNMDSSLFYHTKTKELAIELHDDKTLAMALSDIGNHYGLLGEYDNSFQTYEEAIELFKKVGDPIKYGVTTGHLGTIHMNKGNYSIAQLKFSEALKILDTLETEPYMEADILRKIGHIQYNLKNYEASIEYYKKALKVYLETDDNVFAAEAYIDIGTSYLEMNNKELAISNFIKSIDISEKFDLEGTAAIGYTNLGGAYVKTGEHSLAEEYLNKSWKFHESKGFINNRIQVLQNKAELYLKKQDLENSLFNINTALQIADSVNSLEYQSNLRLFRSKLYEEAFKNETLALKDRKLYEFYRDSIYNLKKTNQIEELKTIYETEKKEAEIALQEEEIKTLNAQSKADKLQKGIYAGGMASALAVSGLLFFGFRQRIKKNRIAREKQEAIYQQEIEHKQKELASQTLHLVQKNTFIQELMENLENIKNSPEKFKMEFRRIVMLLKKENASDKDWEVFKSYFADVHNDFDQKLKTIYPDISEKEIRLAAFLRMNLTTKEIAATLNVLPDSILKSKYRLKKKLGLDKDTDLGTFLNSL
ncbi:tetratricopeptide repeat protein [Maribacter sp. PR1]|uniref:Tetratricopeptide repeat protein n=1 Tax=Maribacter cobaltidurans TaxID=1178778 RepID=A0ABU7IS26_9FLAO|nr:MULTISPECIES: tetratricopeptide repeat protein [Maribacter]MDC6388388.1 tetratricopeptide repeat protein [Maribacter sp. PR1]MEE1975777.1 tetratricopeptide repeat protein [Maribacter cobaltidurans]